MPFVYKVHSIRDGRSYCTRIVNVTQAKGKGICFTCTCSFKKDEASPVEVQESVDLWEKYACVLKDKKPEDFNEAPGMDVPFYWELLRNGHPNDKFPGLKTAKVDMKPYNEPRRALDRRQLIFYKTIGDAPLPPNLQMCAHLYASDRNSLYIAANHLGIGDSWTQMGSLAHTVVFHAPLEEFQFRQQVPSSNPQGEWFCMEDRTDRASAGRSTFHSQVWSPKGTHIMTIMQDGMVRVGKSQSIKKETKL